VTSRSRRTLLGLATGLVVALLLVLLRGTYLFEAAELKTLDTRFRALHDPAKADTNIVIVDVDNLSLDLTRGTLGRFPWPRDVWAMVVQYLAAGGAKAIAFDFTFPEPNLQDPRGDSAFAAAAAAAGTVVQTLSFQRELDTANAQRLAAFREDTAAVRTLLDLFDRRVDSLPLGLNLFQAVEHPYPALMDAAQNLGVINYTPDPVDGTARRAPLLYQFRDSVFLAFGLATALTADSTRFLDCPRWAWRRGALVPCGGEIPVDEHGAMLIKWKGPYRDPDQKQETYRIIPIAQIFRSYEQARAGERPEVPLETFRGKVVFVGASGSGLFEARANPFGPSDPGVLIHATVADNILNRDYLYRARPLANAAALLLAALLAGLAVSVVTAVWASAALGVGLAGVYVALAFWLFGAHSLWLDAATPSLAILLTFTGGMAVNYMTEGRQKRQIREMFSKYVAPEYVAQLAEDPSKLHLEGQRAELSILFSDIRGFTSISEKMQPAEVIAFLNVYLTEMSAIVIRSGGTLDKFIGDAVMAFWGEPVPYTDHADRACDCALAMRDATLKLAERFASEGKPPIRIGIGINTADVVVGNIGSIEHKLDYTVIGDGVNLASRLEGLNKDFATTIIISEFALAKLGDRFAVRPLGDVKVKGKERPVKIYELLGRTAAAAAAG
jgi:adenylate cyclase